jgi:GntR family transcriptional regulator
MLRHIDAQNGIPIYEQIIRQVTIAIADGSLSPGEHVPSVRELATRLAVNPNTVVRSYRDLQSQGILVQVRGTGLAVAPEAQAKCRDQRLSLIRESLRSVFEEAWRNRISKDELRTLCDSELNRLTELNPLNEEAQP